jgi:hypothetical protein
MKLWKRLLIAALVLLTLHLYFPHIAFAGDEQYLFSKVDITKHEPEILSTPEEDIPVIKKKGSSWGWYILLVLVAGGAAAAAAGGGEETQTSPTPPSNGDNGGDTGDVTVTW